MSKRTTIYFDEKIHKKAVSLAKKEGRSLSNYITYLLLNDKIFWNYELKKVAKKK